MSEKKWTFGRVFWPSLVAIIVASILSMIIFFVILGGIIGGLGDFKPKSLDIKQKTVLHMTLDGHIGEKATADFDPTSFTLVNHVSVSEILHAIDEAKEDDKIKGIFLEIKDLNCGIAAAREIRNAINDFEESGKFVYAYNAGELVSLREYYVASAANENYVFPTSTVEFLGLGSELAFFKNTLQKMDVEMQVIRGSNNDFKSAVEPYFLDKMSDSNRVQLETLLNSIWKDIRTEIGKDRNISPERLNEIAEGALVKRGTDAVKYKLMDGILYRDEVLEKIHKKLSLKADEEIHMIAFEKYARKRFNQDQTLKKEDKPNVAVILAEGGVATDGEGLTSKEICKLFQKARENKDIKTVVFRINSPGGSALASEEIWREVKLTNDKKKVIVSMGDLAASGGYYIATPASYIFAEPTTITGSIGVFGVIPYTGKMFENHLGLTFDRVSTNKHAIMTTNRKLTEDEMKLIQEEVDQIYSMFKQRVADGRKMSTDRVDVIARGRVWTGSDALKIGLVDELGGLNDAIKFAATKAGIKDTKVLYYPLVKEDQFADILEAISDQNEDKESKVKVEIPNTGLPAALTEQYKKLKQLEEYTGIQMRMPFEIIIQ